MTNTPEAKTMTFWEHLAELRGRLIKTALAFVVGSIVAWVFRERLLVWVTAPFAQAWTEAGLKGDPQLHFAAPAALFVAYIKLAMIAGFTLALPFVLYQIWAFVAPGLYSHEKRYALPFVLSSTALFTTGAYFCFRVVFPNAFRYLLSFGGEVAATRFAITPTVMIEEYITFSVRMLVAFGVVFELPVLVFFLSVAGIVTYRDLLRFARYFIVIAFIVGAVITPPDPLSQLLLAIPLIGLYGVSVLIAFVVGRRRTKQADSTDLEDAG